MKRWFLIFALALAALLAAGLPLRVRLDAPRMGSPVVLKPGEYAWIECRTSLPWVPKAWVLEALKAQWGVSLDADSLRLVDAHAHGNCYRFRVESAQVMAAPLTHIPGPLGIWTQGPWPQRFRIVHAADLPFPGNEARLTQFVAEMAVVRPHAILMTGDMAYDTDPRWFTFLEAQFARLEAMGILVISCPGNHERKGWAPYLRSFGPHTFHRVNLGPLAILSLDSAHGRDQLTPSQFRWLKKELANLGGRTPLIQVHHPIFPPGAAKQGNGDGSGGTMMGFQREFVRLCEAKGVIAVLTGHWHQDAVFDAEGRLRDDRPDFAGTKYVTTVSLGDSIRRVVRWPHSYFGYRILDFEDGRLVRYTHDLPGLPSPPPIASTPAGTNLSEVRP